MSQIQQFYNGQKIFITGGTGFLGKLLIEKLLRSCREIETIYLLIRAKKGKDVRERIDALFMDTIFDLVRSEYPDFSKKIVGVAGDIAEERLGLSTTDYTRIVDEVTVIFHLAATVRFNEKLDKAVAINVNSVKSIVDIAKACKNLKVGVHVSTAFSHCVRKLISEELYPPPLSYEEVNKLVDDARQKKWSEDEIKAFTEKVLGDWPNTYSFTKAIAEGVIAEFAKEIPFSIFRPSIVTTAYREPIPGWLSSPIGLPGIICMSGLGLLHVSLADLSMNIDIVPVDYVCNALISCAWETAITERRYHEDIPVYNYVSGNQNPVTWQDVVDRITTFGEVYPTNKAIYYPSLIFTKSTQLFTILEFIFHLVPVLIVENVAKLFGKELKLYNMIRKVGAMLRTVGYFSTQEWSFDDQRTQNLWKQIEPIDKHIFPFNIQNIDWDEHALKMIKGCRRFILNEPDETIKTAIKRHFCLYIIRTIVRIVFGIFVLWIIWKMFCGLSSLSTA